ncbi:MAG: ATP-binding protein [Deltaproteobacteria bacterium]|nr:ATP-binding protein [Deltaproteobacteria bacterium]
MNALSHPLPHTHLQVELDWIWALLQHRLRVMQASGIAPLPEDPYPGTTVTPFLVEARLLARAAAAPPGSTEAPASDDPPEAKDPALRFIAQAQAELNAALVARQEVVARRRARDATPLLALREAYQLDDLAYLALALAVAVELDSGVAAFMSYLQGNYEKRQPTLSLVGDILGDPSARLRARRILDAHEVLVSNRLIELDPNRTFEPLLHRTYRVVPRVLRYVEGQLGRGERLAADPEIAAYAELVETADPREDLVLGPAMHEAWDRFRQLLGTPAEGLPHLPILALRGLRGSGRRRWAFELARRYDQRLLVVDLHKLGERNKELSEGLALILREAMIMNAVICFTEWEELLDTHVPNPNESSPELARDRHRQRIIQAFDHATFNHRGAVTLSVLADTDKLPRFSRGTQIHDVPGMDFEARKTLWGRLVTPAIRKPNVDPRDLARRFDLTPGRTYEAVSLARELAGLAGESRVSLDVLVSAVREQIQARMGAIARLRKTTDTWDDLITTPEVGIQLRELCHRYRFRDKVLGEWGLGKRFSSAMGVSALFEGPPGTGKTMSAGVIAKELGLDLYQVELSQIVSKWIGETEKNLSRVFDEAERSGAMLLFDEADSLFSKRTSVSSANDRYANLEVNYLLQRVERFSGIAILTTNFADSIDSAFARRLSMRVTFPQPSIEEREALWKTMIDLPNLPIAGVDSRQLATDFELAGGLIKNAVLRAAFLSAARDLEITHELLHLSARIEMKEHGMLIKGNPHAELVDLLMRMPAAS